MGNFTLGRFRSALDFLGVFGPDYVYEYRRPLLRVYTDVHVSFHYQRHASDIRYLTGPRGGHGSPGSQGEVYYIIHHKHM